MFTNPAMEANESFEICGKNSKPLCTPNPFYRVSGPPPYCETSRPEKQPDTSESGIHGINTIFLNALMGRKFSSAKYTPVSNLASSHKLVATATCIG